MSWTSFIACIISKHKFKEKNYLYFQDYSLSFKSKSSLEQTSHGLDAVNSNIAQQPSPPPPRKRYLIDHASSRPDDINAETSKSSSFHSNSLTHHIMHASNHRDNMDYSLSSKRARLDGPLLASHVAALQYHNSAIPPHLEAIYEAGASRIGSLGDDKSILGEGIDNKLILSHSCPVCAKLFPKASDLKRHMMCHTGEKPFRCQVSRVRRMTFFLYLQLWNLIYLSTQSENYNY